MLKNSRLSYTFRHKASTAKSESDLAFLFHVEHFFKRKAAEFRSDGGRRNGDGPYLILRVMIWEPETT